MAKVEDETWRQSEAYPNDVFGQEGGDVLFEGVDDVDRSAARAKLAAQAPAMARLLLRHQWSANIANHAACPQCEMFEQDGMHARSCELQAVLRAAGVLE